MAWSCFHPSLPGSQCTGCGCCPGMRVGKAGGHEHPVHTPALPCSLPAHSRRRWGVGWEGGMGRMQPSLSWGRRVVVVVQPGRTHLHSKSSHGAPQEPGTGDSRGQRVPVVEQMFRRAWLPETSTVSLVARACEESQR